MEFPAVLRVFLINEELFSRQYHTMELVARGNSDGNLP